MKKQKKQLTCNPLKAATKYTPPLSVDYLKRKKKKFCLEKVAKKVRFNHEIFILIFVYLKCISNENKSILCYIIYLYQSMMQLVIFINKESSVFAFKHMQI